MRRLIVCVACLAWSAVGCLSFASASAMSWSAAVPPGAGLILFSEQIGTGDAVNDAVWVARPDGSHLKRVRAPCFECDPSPRFSPDGRKIAYATDIPSDETVVEMNADGTRRKRLCKPSSNGCDRPLAWSPDGRNLLVGDGDGLAFLNLASRRVRHLATGIRCCPWSVDWSPDGTKILEVDEGDRVWMMGGNGKNARKITDVLDARWSPDGQTLLLIASDESGIDLISSQGGPRKTIYRARDIWSATWSPDGTRIAFARITGLYVLDLRTKQARRIAALDRVCRLKRIIPDTMADGATTCGELDWR